MKILNAYDEYGPGMGFKSMKDFFEDAPYEGQAKIVSYLENGDVTFVSISRGKDHFTGDVIPGCNAGMTDGEYSWISSLSYYVKKYNLRLPKEFETKVLSIKK